MERILLRLTIKIVDSITKVTGSTYIRQFGRMNIGPGDEYNRDRGSLTFRKIATNSTNLFDPIFHMQYHRSDTNIDPLRSTNEVKVCTSSR